MATTFHEFLDEKVVPALLGPGERAALRGEGVQLTMPIGWPITKESSWEPDRGSEALVVLTDDRLIRCHVQGNIVRPGHALRWQDVAEVVSMPVKNEHACFNLVYADGGAQHVMSLGFDDGESAASKSNAKNGIATWSANKSMADGARAFAEARFAATRSLGPSGQAWVPLAAPEMTWTPPARVAGSVAARDPSVPNPNRWKQIVLTVLALPVLGLAAFLGLQGMSSDLNAAGTVVLGVAALAGIALLAVGALLGRRPAT